jgi:mannose-6-phosphate isomerase-like protein (cupin superfamily)
MQATQNVDASSASGRALPPFVVARKTIEALRTVVVDGASMAIGEVRDFRKHSALAAFLPDTARPSFAWARLQPGETHHTHEHPIASMILICSGSGRLIGDVARPVSAGDVVCVPAGARHGFVAGEEELNCLSIQFEGAGLFEDANAPRLRYVDDAWKRYERLQDEWRERWREMVVAAINPLMTDAETAERFWSYVKRWSTRFQHLLYTRQVSVDTADPMYELFRRHLREEFDHDQLIDASPAPWDAELDAFEHWFEGEISRRQPIEKLIIVNGVLESAGEVFAREIRGVTPSLRKYVDLHDECDCAHAEMGRIEITAYVANQVEAALTITDRSWRVFVAMFERIVVLSTGSGQPFSAGRVAAELERSHFGEN